MIDQPPHQAGPTSLHDHRHNRTRQYIDDKFNDANTARVAIDDLLVSVEDWRAHAREAART